ncbi:putative secreted repeat protein (TIGR03808 family) [Methylopila capsulata]|uniref:Secreted repeat protein (TIGR03808 family) n=1 Tax=Methylopila capsulata TaxID=61654 RepID=A0A9W6IXK5_9HYPH|nr:TIGR03808 family TAT-translocated repetitive protein [Methylopila capsulata]MBM7853297.1 putative secreted repeat protein (TIGR03808 family) [Methylopila capsulata]GLK57487.1 Tat protein [Methylopila capsulata]
MPTVTQLNAVDYGFTPTAANPSAALSSAIAAAISQGKPLFIEPGSYTVSNVVISGPIELIGVPGKVTLKMASGAKSILVLQNFSSAQLSGLIFDGADLTPSDAYGVGYRALLVARRTTTVASRIRIERCAFQAADGYGLGISQCAAFVTDSRFSNLYAATGASNHEGFVFEGNRIGAMRNNGVVISRDAGTPAITRIVGNRVDGVSRTLPESTGYQGNAVLIESESNVVVAQNEIHDCAFTAVRLNGCTRARVVQNHCDKHGEVAIYIEGFGNGRQIANDGYDVVVSDNVINDAGVGVAIANIDYSGRLGVISNNIIRRISKRTVAAGTPNQYTSPGKAIAVETCALIANNFVENAFQAIDVSAGSYTQDSVVIGNVLRQTTLAMGVSTVNGAKDVLVADNLAAGFASVASGGGALRQMNAAGTITGTTDLASFSESTGTANLRVEGVVSRASL